MNIKLRYKGTYLGFLWAALEPLFIFVLLYVVFTSIREARGDFAIYLISGIMLYHLFIRGTQASVTIFGTNFPIIISLNIRREFFPVVSTFSVGLLMFIEVALLFALMPVFEFIPVWTIVLLPIVLILFLILMQAMSYLLSIIFVYVKDIQPIWGVLSYALIFVSPIFWYLDEASEILLTIQSINPLGQIIELNHKIILGEFPSLEEWAYTTIFVVSLFFVGYAVFQKLESKIAEKI